MNRTDRSLFASWWWTVDRTLIAAAVVLLVAGLVFSFAASPVVAERIGVADSFHFVKRHAVFFVLALPVLFGVSFLTPKQIRRVALLVFLGSLVLLVAVLFFGQEVKGARRWINLLGVSVQPSEFVKPAFVILCAWLFAEHHKRKEIRGDLLAMLLFAIVAGLLIAQPDIAFENGGRRYEPGALNINGILGMKAGIDLIMEIGLDAISAQLLRLKKRLMERLSPLGFRFIGPAEGANASGITTAWREPGTGLALETLFEALAQRRIHPSLRHDRSGRALMRFSPHFYNTEAEMDRLAEIIAELR